MSQLLDNLDAKKMALDSTFQALPQPRTSNESSNTRENIGLLQLITQTLIATVESRNNIDQRIQLGLYFMNFLYFFVLFFVVAWTLCLCVLCMF